MRRPDPFPLRQAHARPLACFAAAFLLGLMAAKARPLPLWAALVALAASFGYDMFMLSYAQLCRPPSPAD